MAFLSKPHLPQSKVKLCAIAAGNPRIKSSLIEQGIEVIEVQPHKNLAAPVAAHADMQLQDLGQGRVVAASGANELVASLKNYGFAVDEQQVYAIYPNDIALNCFYINKFLFCKSESTSAYLLNYYQSNEVEIVSIKQGYAKCSTCIVDDNSIITADSTIAAAASARGIDVLKIASGHIQLQGYDSGFIGGCCGLIDKNILAFTGKLECHPDAEKIDAFCKKNQIEILELTNDALVDIGGIIPLLV